ncbi:hypothetical protein, partial [Paenirhodobacter hankyongi]|uniref:hypothetical protein n=1 Tax=Paenirhodobacter hankyongi TaxID=2294033 RepID=UPI001C7CDDD5
MLLVFFWRFDSRGFGGRVGGERPGLLNFFRLTACSRNDLSCRQFFRISVPGAVLSGVNESRGFWLLGEKSSGKVK